MTVLFPPFCRTQKRRRFWQRVDFRKTSYSGNLFITSFLFLNIVCLAFEIFSETVLLWTVYFASVICMNSSVHHNQVCLCGWSSGENFGDVGKFAWTLLWLCQWFICQFRLFLFSIQLFDAQLCYDGLFLCTHIYVEWRLSLCATCIGEATRPWVQFLEVVLGQHEPNQELCAQRMAGWVCSFLCLI